MTTLAEQMDELRIATARTKALADVAVTEYDNASWGSADPEQVERVAYMLEAVASAQRPPRSWWSTGSRSPPPTSGR
jgi:hypothetical protein